MPQQLLTKSQIQSLVGVMRDVISYIYRLRKEDPIAEFVQLPKVPPFLSESIAVHLINTGSILLGVSNAHLGGKSADILAYDSNGHVIRIEVKGTGASEWVFLSDKDFEAHFLIWICFDDFFESKNRRNVRIFCVNPAKMKERRQRITLRTLGQVLPGGIQGIDFDLMKFLRSPPQKGRRK